jgi:hypothetical protein
VIFYAIYKIQENGNTIGVTLLRGPWKETGLCNVALGAGGRRGLPESGELAAVLGRGRARGWSRGTRVWFVGLDGVGAAPARGHAGSQGCRPPRLANVRRARLGGEEGRGDEHPHVPRRVLGGLVGGERR